jgi:hypothetical protein
MSTNPAPYPFEYLTQQTLENRLDSVDAMRADIGRTAGGWDQLVSDVIAENSAWVHRIIVAQGVKPSTYAGTDEFLRAWPEIRQAMVRLCRAEIHLIEQQGLESESAEDRSESYRPPGKIRANVRALLESVEPPDSGGGTDDDGFRSTVI